MKDILNSRVKHRQAFRPFAPIVLAERMMDIFEGEEDSPFMLIAKSGSSRMARKNSGHRPCRRHGAGADRARGDQPEALSSVEGVRGADRRSRADQHLIQRQGRADRRDAAKMPCIVSSLPASTIWCCTTRWCRKTRCTRWSAPLVRMLRRGLGSRQARACRRHRGMTGQAGTGLPADKRVTRFAEIMLKTIRLPPAACVSASGRLASAPALWAPACPAASTRKCSRPRAS